MYEFKFSYVTLICIYNGKKIFMLKHNRKFNYMDDTRVSYTQLNRKNL